MDLNEYKNCFNLNIDQFIDQHNISSSQIHENVRYQKIVDVTRLDMPDNQWFYFKDGKLQMVYISDALAEKVWREFESITKTEEPEKTVRSRAGKTSRQVIFAGQGIAASTKRGEVDFVEIYQPCSLQDYLEGIYSEPPPFVR